jgi:hypothetical protein
VPRFPRHLWKRGRQLIRSSGSRQSIVVFCPQAAGVALAFAAPLLFARRAGLEGYGLYSYALSWATLLGLLASVGFPHAAVRLVPAYRVAAPPRGRREFSGTRRRRAVSRQQEVDYAVRRLQSAFRRL